MKLIKPIIFSLLLGASIVIAYKVYNSLKVYNAEFVRIKNADDLAIEQLKKIRTAQKVYLESKGVYAPEWDSLITFINDGEIPIIQRKEHIDKDQFNQDSIWTEIDTLEVVPAYDSLRGALGYSKEDMYMLAIVPSNPDSVQFELRTNMRRGEFFIQVKDPDPINPQRQEGGKLKPLRFGSLATSSTKGNWE